MAVHAKKKKSKSRRRRRVSGLAMESTNQQTQLMVAGIGALAGYMFFADKINPKIDTFIDPTKVDQKLVAAGQVGIGAAYLYLSSQNTTPESKLAALINWVKAGGDTDANKTTNIAALNQMTPSEIDSVYDYIFNFFMKGKVVDAGTDLYLKIQAISEHYNIFT